MDEIEPTPSSTATFALIHDATRTRVAAVNLLDNWWAKGVGVLGMSTLRARTGVVMPGVASIHTLFVRFPLDILFLDKSSVLLKVERAVPPWRPLVRCPGAYYTVELGAGTIDDSGLFEVGSLWSIEPDSGR